MDKYEKQINCEARKVIFDILSYAVKMSTNGNSMLHVKSKELAVAVEEILWEDIGDYLLDYAIYKEGEYWVIDCMFGGAYVPYWDGWNLEEV